MILLGTRRRPGRDLVERLALTPAYAVRPEVWTDPGITTRVRRASDSRGFARPDRWFAGSGAELPKIAARWTRGTHDKAEDGPLKRGEGNSPEPPVAAADIARSLAGRTTRNSRITPLIAAARAGHDLSETDIVRLFSVEGRDLDEVIAAADELRHESVGDTVTYRT